MIEWFIILIISLVASNILQYSPERSNTLYIIPRIIVWVVAILAATVSGEVRLAMMSRDPFTSERSIYDFSLASYCHILSNLVISYHILSYYLFIHYNISSYTPIIYVDSAVHIPRSSSRTTWAVAPRQGGARWPWRRLGNEPIALAKGHGNREFSHEKWWFSIFILVLPRKHIIPGK